MLEPYHRQAKGRVMDPAFHVLTRIPELELEPLAGNNLCCGAAGSYMLNQAEIAQSLRQAKLASLGDLHPDLLVTTNTGCAIFLEAGVRTQEPTIEVLHPVQLLDRQLSFIGKTE